MNPVIVIGMDNTGKTTLIEGMVNQYNTFTKEVLEFKKSLPEELSDYLDEIHKQEAVSVKSPGPLNKLDMHNWCYKEIKKFNSEEDKLVIYDRFGCITEQIYAPIVRNNNDIAHVKHLMRYIEFTPKHQQPLIIYARPNRDNILGFADGREQMEGVIENGEKLLAAYDDLYFQLLHNPLIDIITYDYESDTIADMIRAYLEFSSDKRKELAKVDHSIDSLLSEVKLIPLIVNQLGMPTDIVALRDLALTIRLSLTMMTNMWKKAEILEETLDNEKSILEAQQDLAKLELEVNNAMKELLK